MTPASSRLPQQWHRFRSTIQLTGMLSGGFIFLIIGLSGLVVGHQVGNFVVAVIGVLPGALFVLAALTSYAVSSSVGVEYRYNFRRRVIPWNSIQSFRVARAPGLGPWSILIIDVKWHESVRVGSITGTRKFVQRVIDEFDSVRSEVSE